MYDGFNKFAYNKLPPEPNKHLNVFLTEKIKKIKMKPAIMEFQGSDWHGLGNAFNQTYQQKEKTIGKPVR